MYYLLFIFFFLILLFPRFFSFGISAQANLKPLRPFRNDYHNLLRFIA